MKRMTLNCSWKHLKGMALYVSVGDFCVRNDLKNQEVVVCVCMALVAIFCFKLCPCFGNYYALSFLFRSDLLSCNLSSLMRESRVLPVPVPVPV